MILRRPLVRMGLIAGFFFLLGFSYNYHLPRIESFLLIEVERLSEKHSPVRIWAQRLHFHLLPLGIVLEDVRLLPQKPLDNYLAPARLKEAGARLAVLPLLRGEIRLSSVFIRDSELSVFLRPELFERKSTPNSKGVKLDFEEIYRLPVDEIALERVNLQGRLDPQNVVFRVTDFNLVIENRYKSLFVEMQAPSVQIKPSGPIRPLNAQLELRTLVEAHEMQVSALKAKADDSFIVASGRFNGDIAAGQIDNGAFDARMKVQLSDVNIWEKVFVMKPQLPQLQGRAEMDFAMEVRQGKGYMIESDVKSEGIAIDKFKIGSVQGRIASNLKSITSERLQIANNAGKVQLSKVKVNLEGTPSFSAAVVPDLEVRQLLENINVKKVPILVPLKGDTECQGTLGEKPEMTCKGKLLASRIWVHSGAPKNSTIVDLEDARIEGDVKVTAKDVQYKAEAQLGKNSKGRSSGIIDYDKGFKILYTGDNLNFGDVKNLSDLKLEGEAKIDGITEGDSDAATLTLNAEAKDLWLEDYPLGRVNSKVTYKDGHLGFSGVQGQYGTSQFTGQVNLDLDKHQIAINGNIPFADLHDLKQIFQRKIDLPFDVSGTGQGTVEAHGPLRFQDMSYKVRSSFFRGEIAGETFDELVFNVNSKDGLVTTERFTLSKSSGGAEAKGQITPKGEIDLVVVARGMRLEQSENVLKYGLDLQGMADFTMLVRGQLPKPRIELNGRLSRVVLADQPAEDSVFKLNFLSDRVEGSGQFLGSTLLVDATYPYSNEAPFLLKLKARKWDFTSLFSLVSKSARQLDFSTSVSANINLASPQGGFWAASGQAEIDEFVIRKASKSMQANKPMYLTMRNGEVNSNNFTISSGDSFLKLDVSGLTYDRLNASLNGKLDLSLLGLFTPFISDLRGNMAISMDLAGSVPHPNLSGSAYIDRGYAKFVDFIHPFSNVRADILFNDNQVLLNSVRGDTASGKLSGDGKITFSGKTRPIDVKGTFSDVKINVPEGFRTNGSGTIAITGNNFPYTMSVGYNVTGGEVTYEFGEDAGGATTVKASSYLPRFLYQDSFHPFTFDIDIDLKNPVFVNNSLAQVQALGHIQATGTPDHLLLTGTLTPNPGGKVFFNETPFDISSAFIEYTGNPPANPRIYLTASTRVTEISQDDNQRATEIQYDVNMLAQGRGPIPQILLSSQPPLSQREIVSLLALGVTSGAMDKSTTTSAQAASNTSTALGAAILQKAGSKRLKESLGLDVKVSSSSPAPDNASTPKVTLSKQFTPKLGASASSTLQANPSNSVRLEYKMNKSMSVIGSWEGREYVREQTQPVTNVLGLDLEYKLNFK
ncbi:MAG: translocation/assembly module TamB [Bdellovibrionales bacterium]|nr:translocation/assembly module TamB [Bdellovibrionales bacterium]